MLRPAENRERLCWRAWPCHECGKGLSPVSHLIGCIDSDKSVRTDSFEVRCKKQVGWLQRWVGECPHIGEHVLSLTKVGEGSEHRVYADDARAKVYKATLRNVYGDWYFLDENNLVHQASCTPIDYLIRLHIWDKLFGSFPTALGITEAGQIVSIQDFIQGAEPTQEAVDAFLESANLTPVKKSRWLWKRDYPEISVWVGDARCDNFVTTEAGIAPIDIRLWFT